MSDTLRESLDALLDRIPDVVECAKTARLEGILRAPGSKSWTHRAIMVCALGNHSHIDGGLLCADTTATAAVFEGIGARIRPREETGTWEVEGTDGLVTPHKNVLNVGESGTLLRMLLPGLGLHDGEIRVTGEGSLTVRPNVMVTEPMRQLGIEVEGTPPEDRVPIKVRGKGRVRAGRVSVDGSRSSQPVSAFLLWSGLFEGTATSIEVTGKPVSAPYVDMTIRALEWAGIRITRSSSWNFTIPAGQSFETEGKTFEVPGDFSSAAFIMCAAALNAGEVIIEGLQADDTQADKRIIDVLQEMGALVRWKNGKLKVRGTGELHGVEVNCSDCPDLVPVLMATACFADSPSRFHDIAHLRIKESNRMDTPAEQLACMGAHIETGEDEVRIYPSRMKAADVDACGDHRIGMALAVAGMRLPGTRIRGMKCIAKSYPGFIEDMISIGAVFHTTQR